MIAAMTRMSSRSRRVRVSVLAVTMAGAVSGLQPFGAVLEAQNVAPPVSADTEILTPGHRDFSRYDTPGWCSAAGGWTANVVRGTVQAEAVLDTLRPSQDTLGAAAVAAVTRACGARFTVATTAVARPPNLFDLALQEQADSVAMTAVARFAQLHRDVQWAQVLKGYLVCRDSPFPMRRLQSTRVFWMLACVGSSPLTAQSPVLERLASPSSVHTIVDTIPWATITTDTGDFSPGHRDFTRYTTLHLCRIAVQRTRMALQRTRAARAAIADFQHTPDRDTLLAGTIATVARTCIAPFTVSGTAATELPTLFDLALLAQRPALAHEVLVKQLSMAPTDGARNLVLLSAVRAYLAVRPARLAAADSLIAQLDARGSSALAARLLAHDQLLTLWRESGDFDRQFQAAQQILAVIDTGAVSPALAAALRLPPAGRQDTLWARRAIIDAIATNFVRAVLEQPDSLAAVGQLARSEFSKIAADKGEAQQWADASLSKIEKYVFPFGKTTLGGGEQTPRLRADFWFPAPGRDTVEPAPGHVSLIYIPERSCHNDNEVMYWNIHCVQAMEQLQRWQQQYATAGLQITVVGDLDQDPWFSDPMLPAAEARDIEHNVHQYWRLPVTVVIRGMPFDSTGDNSVYQKYHPDMGVFLLTGRNGKMIVKMAPEGGAYPYWDTFTPGQIALLDALLARSMAPLPQRVSTDAQHASPLNH